MKQKPDFGWLLPIGQQRMPDITESYWQHLHRILNLLDGHFHSAWIPDHLMEEQAHIPEAMTTLSYLAGCYPRLFWGTSVICQSFRNPALLAKMAATIQELTDGRFILGIGAGWKTDEYQAYGYEFPPISTRIDQLEEVIQICQALWRPDQPEANFDGCHFQVKQAICQPKPSPLPPIMIGGGGEKKTLRVVAKHADWWNLPGAGPDLYMHKLAVLGAHCARVGRPISTIRKTWMGAVSIAPSREEATEQLSHHNLWPNDKPLVGNPIDIWDQLKPYLDMGVDMFILSFVDEPELRGLNLFLEHIVEKY